MKLFDILTKEAPIKIFLVMLLGTLAGVAHSLLIPLILASFESDLNLFQGQNIETVQVFFLEVSNYRFAALYFVLCLFILVTRSLSQVLLTRTTLESTTKLRIRLYKRIAKLPLLDLENIGTSKLLANLTVDVPHVVMGGSAFPNLLTNGVTLLGMLGFILYLNTNVFFLIMGSILFGVIAYQIPIFLGEGFMSRAREQMDNLHQGIKGLLFGAKELKLNNKKRHAFFEETLINTELDLLKNDKRGQTVHLLASDFGEMIMLFVIGFVAFVFINYSSLTSSDLVGIVMVLLYITGPVAMIVESIPGLAMAKISLKKLNQLFQEMPTEELNESSDPLPEWDTIRFQDICYHYEGKEDSNFQLGPINFEIQKGEITFIVGGNGSGKSTMSKILTLHYLPDSGSFYFGDVSVDSTNRNLYRQEISAIYSDYYLFDKILGIRESQEVEDKIEKYLSELQLDKKVEISNHTFSTLSLSDGQKKRLALLVSFLEDRNLYIFDEWAADQDPVFKQIFYYEILPELRKQGKAVVVISHDDRYFDLADQIITMENGKILRKTSSPPTESF